MRLILAACGQSWLHVVNPGCMWSILAACGQSWSILAEYGQSWLNLVNPAEYAQTSLVNLSVSNLPG